jgi:beta-N-acetylhexosaminidase
MFMVGFPGLTPDADLLSLVGEGVFGAILFKRNVESAAQVEALCFDLKSRAARAFTLAVDQEGGRVARLREAPFTALPPMREIGRRGDLGLAEQVGRLLALEVRAVGFDWDFAPVLDVDTNPKNPVIGDRAFHQDAQAVAQLGVALAKGLEAGGVASCAKHFPGHGDTTQDSHHDLPRLPHDLSRLKAVELAPFAAYAKARLASVMTAHVVFEAIAPQVPATLSREVLEGLLRRELSFEGVVVSDDLEMKAIADHYSVEEAAVQGAQAGVDLFLVCHRADRQKACIDALEKAVKSGRVSQARIAEANRRLDTLEARFTRGPEKKLATLGTESHRRLTQGLWVATAGADPTESSAGPAVRRS